MSRIEALQDRIATDAEFDAEIGVMAQATEDRGEAPQGTDLAALTGMDNASLHQIAIFQHLIDQINHYINGTATSSLAVQAVAGSGKTTTIIAAANLIPTHLNAIFLAFNKPIAVELDSRLPKHVKGQTLNALGYGLLRRYLSALGIHDVDLIPFRTKKLIDKELTFAQRDAFKSDVDFLVGMCKSMGVIPVGVNDGYGIDGMQATDEVLTHMCVHHGRMVDPVTRNTVYSLTRRILALSWSDERIYEDNMIDYDDQKWLTVCKRPGGRSMARSQFDIVIIDEVQDVNAVDIALIQMVLKTNGIVIGVGDSNQAIYGFRGADTKAFETFSSSFNAITLPLSTTYRCGTDIVEYAQKLVPTIQAAPGAHKGAVENLANYSPSMFQPGDLVLCRNNAPLIEFAYKLIRARVPVLVKGRDLGKNLIRVITECVAVKTWVPNPKKPGSNMPQFSVEGQTVITLAAALIVWRDKQIDLINLEDPDNEGAKEGVQDKFECITLFIESNADNKVTSVIEDIQSLFTDGEVNGAVTAATIHKTKGLEADRVFMYKPSCMYPHWVAPGTWQAEQEANLDYVARTRAKNLFAYLAPGGWTE